MPQGKPRTDIIGTVVRVKEPFEWTTTATGKQLKKIGVNITLDNGSSKWINYTWWKVGRDGREQANPFSFQVGVKYDFTCIEDMYKDKEGKPQISLTIENFRLLSGAPTPQEEPRENDPTPQEEKPSGMAPTMGKIIAVENYEGKNYIVVLAENGATIWATC